MSSFQMTMVDLCLSVSSVAMILVGLIELSMPRVDNIMIQNSRWLMSLGGSFGGISYLLNVRGVAAICLLLVVVGYLMAKYAIWRQVCDQRR